MIFRLHQGPVVLMLIAILVLLFLGVFISSLCAKSEMLSALGALSMRAAPGYSGHFLSEHSYGQFVKPLSSGSGIEAKGSSLAIAVVAWSYIKKRVAMVLILNV
jgi:hypothetical protein